MMRRYLSLFLPAWPLTCAQRRQPAARPDEGGAPVSSGPAPGPCAVVSRDAGRRVLLAVDPAAEAAGLCPGQGVADAQALVPDLTLLPAAPAEEARRLGRLAERAFRYGPTVMLWGADALLVDITGCAALFGGEAALLDRAATDYAGWKIPMRAAIADSPRAACALAKAGLGPAIAPAGQTQAALASLPLAALDIAPDLRERLRKLGWRRIGDLLPVPRASLTRRFGAAFTRLLAEAWGEVATLLIPLTPPPRFTARTTLVSPLTTLPQVLDVASHLLDALLPRLERAGCGLRLLAATLEDESGRGRRVVARFASPTRRPGHILKLLALILARDGAAGEISAVTLEALATAPLPPAQGALPGSPADGAAPEALAALIDRLAGRLGNSHLYALSPRACHLPERAVARRAPFPATPGEPAAAVPRTLRPVRLFARPEPIEAVAPVPDAPPVLIRWRHLARRVVRADGPERIAPEWWRDRPSTPARDYYRIEDETGRRYWVFRAGPMHADPPPRWFLHGVFA